VLRAAIARWDIQRYLGKGPKGETPWRQPENSRPAPQRSGDTTIQDAVVLALANVAAQEIEGVHLSHGGIRLPGDSSPTVGEFLGNVTAGWTSAGASPSRSASGISRSITESWPSQASSREEERSGYLVRERRSGSFRRSLQLPQDVDEDQIKANFENGVLEVRIPGAAAVQEPKRIQIGGGDSPDDGSSSS
jgi:Hsp20/alpha crystallin family